MIRYLMRQATSDMTVKPAGAGQPIEGREWRNRSKRWLILNVTASERLGGWR